MGALEALAQSSGDACLMIRHHCMAIGVDYFGLVFQKDERSGSTLFLGHRHQCAGCCENVTGSNGTMKLDIGPTCHHPLERERWACARSTGKPVGTDVIHGRDLSKEVENKHRWRFITNEIFGLSLLSRCCVFDDVSARDLNGHWRIRRANPPQMFLGQ